ncbi:hypothetical protein [Micromonospora sp. RTGN7]|uniref:hypothetical protein n=1 Tax=Micromonospora sp. RTGN7 TaxID=3016526 RepID=UPI0029FECDAD|nr:hypothetical protein [Micromonospora sp. RTGN7]
MAVTVVTLVAENIYNWATSSASAVNNDRNVEEAKKESIQKQPPFSVNAYYYHRSTEARVRLFPQRLTAKEEQQLLALQRTLKEVPEGLEVGLQAVVQFSRQGTPRLLTRVRLSIVGGWTQPIFVRQLRAKVLQRSPPLAGAYLFHGDQGGEAPLEIGFNLDETRSLARVVKKDGISLGEAYMDRHVLELKPGEPKSIDVQAFTDRSYCEWVIELDCDLGDERRTVTIDDDGKPFRSTRLAPHYEDRYYAGIAGKWIAEGAGPAVFKI